MTKEKKKKIISLIGKIAIFSPHPTFACVGISPYHARTSLLASLCRTPLAGPSRAAFPRASLLITPLSLSLLQGGHPQHHLVTQLQDPLGRKAHNVPVRLDA